MHDKRKQWQSPEGDVYVAGRQFLHRDAPEEPEADPGSAETETGHDNDEDADAVTIHRTVSDGPTTIQQHVTAGRNAFAVSGDAVIHVRNRG